MQDYCDLPYPFKVRASKRFLEELYCCEEGRYEDACHAREYWNNEDMIANGYNLVFCDFGRRFKTQLEIRNEQELEETLYALNHGTIDLFMPRAAERMEDELTRIILGKAPRQAKPKPKPTKEEKQARDEFHKVVRKTANKCIDHLIKTGELKGHANFKTLFQVRTKNIRRCWGGEYNGLPGISISNKYMTKTGNFEEYEHIESSDFIGAFYSEKNSDHVKAVVSHEVAHAVNQWNEDRYFGHSYKAHGKEWQKLYKSLRVKFKLVGMPRPKGK